MATHSSILAWRIPGTGEPGGLLSMGLHRVWHDWSDLAAAAGLKIAFQGSLTATKQQSNEWCWWPHKGILKQLVYECRNGCKELQWFSHYCFISVQCSSTLKALSHVRWFFHDSFFWGISLWFADGLPSMCWPLVSLPVSKFPLRRTLMRLD